MSSKGSSLIALQSTGVCYPPQAPNASGSRPLPVSPAAGTAEPENEATVRACPPVQEVNHEYGVVPSPDLQLRDDHAARRGGDRPRLPGQDHAGQPALRSRACALQGSTCRRRTHHRRLHPGSAAVSRGRRKFPASRTQLRQHSRNRRLVRSGGRGRSESREPDCGCRRRDAADFAGDAGEQRRRADLWPRRGRDRGRPAARRPPRHHGASHQTRRRDPAPEQRVSGAQGHHPQCTRTSRRLRAWDRRLRPARAVLARQTRVRRFAQWRHLDLRPDPRSLRRRAIIPRA